MDVLGKISQPEQYYPVDNHFILSDSLEASDYFKDELGENGVVCLVLAKFASLSCPFAVLWAYISLAKHKLLGLAPVFKMDSLNNISHIAITDVEVIDNETFFYWKDAIHAAVLTEDQQIAVRQVRAVLCSTDMQQLLQLSMDQFCSCVYPVKLFKRSTGEFLAVFWLIEIDDSRCAFEAVCCDETPMDFSNSFLKDTFYHVIEPGEKVIIDGAYYKVCNHPKVGYYFERLPFIATAEDLQRENIPQQLFMNLSKQKDLPKLRIASIKPKK
ncbi:MAG: hypothetical protein IJ864_00845 [Alphaproteobacteria bacterium]|nr:hypothetical protein [Alphaproteobacteria bacterium]